FAEGHIPGSLSIELRPAFATWIGWLLAPEGPIVFVLDPDQDRADVVRQCLKIGYEELAGELAGGMDSWARAGHATTRIDVIDPDATTGTIVDVRQSNELHAGRIPTSVHVEL